MVVINAINEPVTFVPLTFAFISQFLTLRRKDKSQMRSLSHLFLIDIIEFYYGLFLRKKCSALII